MDVREFDEFLRKANVSDYFGSVDYDDSYEINSGGLPTFEVKFVVDMDDVDDEDDALREVKDEMERIENAVWRFDGITDVYGNRAMIRIVCQFTYTGVRHISPGRVSQWLD